jgi:hypothetical protein
MKLTLMTLVLAIGLSSTAMAGACLAVTADNIAVDNGCNLGDAILNNFTFTVTNGSLLASDNTISFFTESNSTFQPNFGVTVTGDSFWNLSGGSAWSFTFSYTIDTALTGLPCFELCVRQHISNFAAIETGASATGSGASSTTETLLGLTGIATTAQPNSSLIVIPGDPSFDHVLVTNVVSNSAGNGTSSLTSITDRFVIPEPGTWLLTAGGLAALIWRRKLA